MQIIDDSAPADVQQDTVLQWNEHDIITNTVVSEIHTYAGSMAILSRKPESAISP